MRHHRITSSLALVLGLLALLVMPLTASAGGPSKKAAATSKATAKKKVDPARSAAAKKGWETRRINQKAESNWASRVGKNPKLDTPGAKEAFVKRSVAAQRGWQTRKANQKSATPPAKQKIKKVSKKTRAKAKTKKAGDSGKSKKKGKKVAKTTGKKSKTGGAAPDSEEGIISAGVGKKDFKNALAKFDEARFAQSEGRSMDAAFAQMEGHDAMAQSAFDTADELEAAGRLDEAEKLNAFGEDHLAKANTLEAAINQQQANEAGTTAVAEKRPGRVRRFFARLNPFKKRGGGEPARVAGGE